MTIWWSNKISERKRITIITEKALEIIRNCSDLKHVHTMQSYTKNAELQILKKKYAKNYEYATIINRAAQSKFQYLINQQVIALTKNNSRKSTGG